MPSNTNEYTEREKKVLELYKQGKSARYIAEMLCNRLNAVLKHPFSDILGLSATYTCIVSTWFGGIKNAVQESQLCYMLFVTANLDKEKEEGGIIFIDTENTFRPQRIHQIAEVRGRAGRNNSAYLDLYDEDDSNPLEDYEEKVDLMWELIQKHGKAVMCCVAGISQSNAIALGLLLKYFKWILMKLGP